MKILLISESYWPNADGGALFERRLVQGLRAAGDEVVVWAPGERLRDYIEQDGNYTIYREKSSHFIFNWRYRVSYWPWWRGQRIIRQFRPDVIHIHNPAMMGLTGLLWAKRYKIPVLGTNHLMPENVVLNLPLLRHTKLFKRLIWSYLVWFHNGCSFVTSPTQTAIKLLRQEGLYRPARAVSNGVDSDQFEPRPPREEIAKKYRISRRLPTILYLGRLDGEKRLDLVIKALPLVLKQRKVQLVIAGRGKAAGKLKKIATQLGVSNYICFTGFIDEADKAALYNLANLFVIASPAELQSIVTLEALSSGLPVVAVDVAALKELCHNGENGFLFEEDNYQQMADRIIALFTDKALARNFGQASRQLVLSHHTNKATIHAYEAIYTRLAGGIN